MPATGLLKKFDVDETYDIMTSLNSVQHNLVIITHSIC